jgi:SMC interacting uncharacterized protein involved in chromosome segregation
MSEKEQLDKDLDMINLLVKKAIAEKKLEHKRLEIEKAKELVDKLDALEKGYDASDSDSEPLDLDD